jgi:hypothetical protein
VMGIQPGPEVPLLIAFDDGIGGTVDGARVLLSTAIEDDDTPGKLLYHYPPASALEKVYFMLGFVIQVPKLMSELHGATFPSMSKLLGAQRRLATQSAPCAPGTGSQLTTARVWNAGQKYRSPWTICDLRFHILKVLHGCSVQTLA